MKSLSSLILPVVLVAAAPARAAVTIVAQHGATTTTITLDGDHARIDHPQRGERGGASTTILDAATKKLIMINDEDKSYRELTEADRQRMKGQVEAMRAQMKDRLKDMPPEQRQRFEQMMGGGAAEGAAPATPKSSFESFGGKKTINGFTCQMYKRVEEGKVREEICAAPWSAGLLQKSDFAALQKFAAGMMDDLGGPAMRRARRNPLADLDSYPGIPISRVAIEPDGKRGEEDQIKSIKRGSVAADRFAVPAGYAKKEIDLGRGRRGGGPGHGPGQAPE
jgi:hypothetical protein